MKAAAEPCEFPRGTTLGRYKILRKIATGGMAEIYLACIRGQAGFEKLVVLKRILPHFAADPRFVEMFLDEARLAATLRHPNIADVYDIGEVDGTPFFAMEYIHGQDAHSIRLMTWKRRERIPLAIALAIIQGTAAALQCAHQMQGANGRSLGLIHRDVSAANVIVSYDGAIKLLDFGIAHANDHQHKTQTGTLKGKAPYMSPEQCRGERLDCRTDLFSLGVVMFELTLGRRPFRGENDFLIMEQIVNGRVPAPSSITAGYPPELEAIVMKLLAHDRSARYATAEEMLLDLESFVAKHQLWVSANSVGKYMRRVFAGRVHAWERASHQGVLLGQYATETTTSPSHKATSQRKPSKAPVAYPEFRSSRRAVVAMLVALLVVAGGGAGFYAWQTQHELTAARGASAPVEPGAPEPLPKPSLEPSRKKPAVPEPSPQALGVPEPSPQAPAVQPPPAELRVEVRPAAVESAPAPDPSSMSMETCPSGHPLIQAHGAPDGTMMFVSSHWSWAYQMPPGGHGRISTE